MEIDESIVTSEADEEHEQQRFSTVATFGILVATIVAAIAGSLAALASIHGDQANGSRVAWATYSNEQLLAYNQYAIAQGESVSTYVEEAWRLRLLEDLADGTSDPTLRTEIGTEALQASDIPPVGTAPRVSFSSPSPAQFCRGLGQPYDCAYEVSSGYATTSLNDDRQERAYIACLSMLAIALFLFALSKMLSQPSMERLFLALGTVITLVAVGWVVAEPIVTRASRPSISAIRAYETGWQDEQRSGPPATVEALLRTATSEDPSMVDAWQQLGEEEILAPRTGAAVDRCPAAIAALTRAWDLRGAPDDLDRLAVGQVLCGAPARALALLHEAPADPSDVSAGPARALAELASGQSKKALRTLGAAVSTMEHQGTGVRGPVFRTYWFEQLLADVRALGARGDNPQGVRTFVQRMVHDEVLATLHDDGLDIPAPSPNASVRATVSVATSTLGSAASLVPVAIDLTYSGLRNGDVIVVTWDQATTVENIREISLTLPGASVAIVGRPGGPKAGSGTFVIPAFDFVATGRYQLDTSVNAVTTTQPMAVSISPAGQGVGPQAVPLVVPKPPPPPPPPTTPTTTTTTTICENHPTTTTTFVGEPPLAFTC